MTDSTNIERANRVVPQMRERLQVNRSGKLTVSQWTDIVSQPLVSLLILMTPLVFILPRFILLLRAGWWMAVGGIAIVMLMLVFRAYRYARLPVHFAHLQAPDNSAPFWMFWKPVTLQTPEGERISFKQRLSPPVQLRRNQQYIAYYLKDGDDYVLLSLAAADHPDASRWHPDAGFAARFKRRTR